MTILGTAGHRPQKGATPPLKLRLLAQQVLMERRPSLVIVGMAVGWDMAVAEACVDTGVPFTAAVPFEGQESRWPQPYQDQYWKLLGKAAKVVHVSPPGYSLEKMHKRNQWIADRMDSAVVLWDGFDDSGTADFVRRAQTLGIEPVNLWGRWQEFRHQL